MSLMIYMSLDGDSVDLEKEDSITSRWNDNSPLIGDLVSMGGDTRWQVVEVSIFQSTELHPSIDAIYIVQVHPSGMQLPPKEEWLCQIFKEDHPNESMFLHLLDESIEVGFDMRGEHPKVGSQLQGYEQIEEHSTAMRSYLRPWFVDRVETFLPVGSAPYSKVDVCLCRELALVA